MPRPLSVAVPFALLAACATPPPVVLQLRDAFPTLYEGRIQPAVASAAAPAELASKAVATAAAIDDGAASAAMRAWLVQLPTAEARAVLTGWAQTAAPAAFGFGIGGHHVDREAMVEQLRSWNERGAVLSQPFLVARFGHPSSVRMARQTSAICGFQLRQSAASLMLDPWVQSFEHGTEIGLLAERRGDDVFVALDWQHSELLQPRTTAALHGGGVGNMEVPVQMRHRLTGETKVAPHDAVVLGVLPSTTPDTVLLLCVETELQQPAAAVAVVKTPTPR